MFVALNRVEGTDRNFNQKRVAFTIDDLPFEMKYLPWSEKRKYSTDLLEVLKKHKIKTTAFIIGESVTDENLKIITDFLDYGHDLGNHTYFHSGPNGVSAQNYIYDILLCDSILEIIKSAYNKNKIPKLGIDTHQKLIFDIANNFEARMDEKKNNGENIHFRYPYLKRGNSKSKRDSIMNFLSETNHKIAPVTITSHDWKFADSFYEAYKLNDQDEMERIGEAYVAHVIDQVQKSFKHSRRELGLSIDHVFLMHMNLLNAFYFERILNWFAENKWEFIDLEKAMEHRFFNWEDSYYGSEGIPWLYRAKKLMNSIPF